MAIAGLLIHSFKEELSEVESKISLIPELTLFGNHDDHIAVVADTPSSEMEKLVDRVAAIDGVLAVYTTFLSIEDELADVQG